MLKVGTAVATFPYHGIEIGRRICFHHDHAVPEESLEKVVRSADVEWFGTQYILRIRVDVNVPRSTNVYGQSIRAASRIVHSQIHNSDIIYAVNASGIIIQAKICRQIASNVETRAGVILAGVLVTQQIVGPKKARIIRDNCIAVPVDTATRFNQNRVFIKDIETGPAVGIIGIAPIVDQTVADGQLSGPLLVFRFIHTADGNLAAQCRLVFTASERSLVAPENTIVDIRHAFKGTGQAAASSVVEVRSGIRFVFDDGAT
jgi:hypothetical protein